MNESTKRTGFSTLFFLATTIILAFLLIALLVGRERYRGYDSASVMTRIAYIQELALVQHNHLGVIDFRDNITFLNRQIPLTDKFFLLRYNGYVKAGIDFNRVKVNVLNAESVHVSIPRPRILSAAIDESSIKVYNESMNMINPIRISDYTLAITREKNVMIRYAIEQGIYAQATEHAKVLITSLLKDMGFTDIKITEELILPIIH
jgi:hypothetical protein